MTVAIESSTIMTERLVLQPLRVEDADEMADVLADPALHQFTGGRPATLDELRGRYASWVEGSGTDAEVWLNWIIRRRSDACAVGAVQATIDRQPGAAPEGCVAWTIGTPWQRQGLATEAAVGLVQWLHEQGIASVVAHIHPDHTASAGVAAKCGLRPTDDEVDGEIVWRSDPPAVTGQSV
jgi:RimJ/RimL family protein N-acetyltransferase